jgi:hypothetical protein
MTSKEQMEKGAEELIGFINKVMSGIKIPAFSKPTRVVNHTNITVVIQSQQKGWIRRQLAKVF